ncbi:MFS transporter [Rosenbergiella australiborealis]|uniref:MFS transporter n=1 Tax=Rosenbergiella australiborealis TaxID=1544696 RepID=UPI001F4E0404|nr:MFS transporter [Rosenbergiella australiborealis]
MTVDFNALPPQTIAARIDALPATRPLWVFISLLAIGGFFELFDLFETGYISSGLVADHIFHLGEEGLFGISDQAAFAAVTFLGLFVGASLLAPFADRYGRRLTFIFALGWYGLFSLIMAFQQSSEGILLCRFLVGMGLGVELVTIDTYLAEWTPAHLRSKAFAFAFFIQFLSVPAVALLSWWLIPHQWFSLAGWRWVIIIGALFSAIIWLIRRHLPESPRWLMEKNRVQEAHHIMMAMEKRCGAKIVTDLPTNAHAEVIKGQFRDIWSAKWRRRTLMLMVMNFFQAIGFFGFGNWLPTLLSGKGASLSHSLLYAFFITLAYPLGSLLCTLYADKLENKWQIVAASLMTVICGTGFALTHQPWIMVLCGFLITYSNAWLTYSYHAYQTEIFPTAIRARAVGFCYSFSRLSTALSSILIGLILTSAGSSAVILFIVFSMLMVMLSVAIFGPTTRGKDLENI